MCLSLSFPCTWRAVYDRRVLVNGESVKVSGGRRGSHSDGGTSAKEPGAMSKARCLANVYSQQMGAVAVVRKRKDQAHNRKLFAETRDLTHTHRLTAAAAGKAFFAVNLAAVKLYDLKKSSAHSHEST